MRGRTLCLRQPIKLISPMVPAREYDRPERQWRDRRVTHIS